MNETNASDKKPWETPWTYDQINKSAKNWSLAGNAGVLLHLKQFSDQVTNSCLNLEKSLDQLVYNQLQCEVRLNNTTSDFLMLENTQFIENLVSEDDADLSNKDGTNKTDDKKEKTKEEKDAETLLKINEAVQIGLSIMDKYFEKIDSKMLDNDNNGDDENDDDEYGDEDNENVVLYEMKDPYILRPLPCLIGSTQYIEDDFIGLKDSDDEDEVVEEELQQDDDLDDESSDDASEDIEDEEDEEEVSNVTATPAQVKREFNIGGNDNDNDSDSDNDNDLFKTVKIKKRENLFDDDESNDSEKTEEESFKDDENRSVQEDAVSINKPLDFAAELAKKFANKNANNSSKSEVKKEEIVKDVADSDNDKAVKKEQPVVQQNVPKITKPKSLFDDDNESDEENDLFFTPKSKLKSKLFDDDDDEDSVENEPAKKQVEVKPVAVKVEPSVNSETERNRSSTEESLTKQKLPSGAQSLFKNQSALLESALQQKFKGKNADESQTKENVTNKKVDEEVKPVQKPLNTSLFGNDNDDEDDLFSTKKVEGKKSVALPKKSLFDDEEADLFNMVKKDQSNVAKIEKAQTTAPKKVVSLFDDEEENDLFAPKPTSKPQETPVIKASLAINKKDVKASLFGDESDDDLFNTLNNKVDKVVVKPVEKVEKKLVDEPVKKVEVAVEKPKPKESSLFDNESDDDLFSTINKKVEKVIEKPVEKVEKKLVDEPVKKVEVAVEKPKPKESSLFDNESDDDLFSTINKKVEKPVEKKEPIISVEKTVEPVIEIKSNVKNQPIITKEELKKPPSFFDSDDDDNDDLFKSNITAVKSSIPKILEEVKIEVKQEESKKDLLSSNEPAPSNTNKPTFSPLYSEIKKLRDLNASSSSGDSSSEDDDIDLFKSNSKTKDTKIQPSEPLSISKDVKVETAKADVLIEDPLGIKKSFIKIDSDDNEDLFTTKPKKEDIQEVPQQQPKKSIVLLNKNAKSDNLFQELNKKLLKTSPTSNETLLDSPPPMKVSEPNDEESKQIIENKPSLLESSEIKKGSLKFNDEDDDTDLFKPTKSIIEKDEKKSVVKTDVNEEKPEKAVFKNFKNSININPANLLPGAKPKINRPSIVAQSEEAKEIKPENKGIENDFVTPKDEDKPKSNDDKLDVDRCFNDQTIKSAQKDRIRVAQKRRPPTQRKKVTSEEQVESEIKVEVMTSVETILPTVITEVVDEPKYDDIKKPIEESPKKSEPTKSNLTKRTSNVDLLFDDDTDLFADVSLLTKSTKEQTTKNIVKTKKSMLKDDIFDENDEDLFGTKQTDTSKSKPKLKTKNLFADIDDLFDDPLNVLNNKK